MEKEIFGFIGLGAMGRPMTSRLLAAGHQVHVHDRSAQAMAALADNGAVPLASAAQVADAATTVFLSLPTPAIVAEVATGRGGLAEGGAVRRVVDFSTIGPRTASRVAAALAEKNIHYVDAPVSGGIAGAANGTLAVMVACAPELFADMKPTLQIFGKPFHAGHGAGQAQTLKLANNLLSVAAIALTSEVMAMGVKAGLSPQLMLEAINAGSGRNSATQDKFPRSVLPGTFDFGFQTGLAYKDVRLCIDEAGGMGIPMVVGSAVREIMAVTEAMFGSDSDFTSMCRVVEAWAKVQVRA